MSGGTSQAFAEHFARCGLVDGELVAFCSANHRAAPALVETARLAAQSLGGRVFDVVVPTPTSSQPVPIRSTGASQAIAGNTAVIAALSNAGLVIDCTVEGLLHAPELGAILAGGARVLMISNEHPDIFDRLGWDPDLPRRVELAHHRLRSAGEMRVTSDEGTDLTVDLAGAVTAGSTGVTAGPGSIAHWPGGLVIAFPAANTVNGRLVMAAGDINLTFNRIVESPIELTIAGDHITEIGGSGVDAQLFRSYLGSFGDRAELRHEPRRLGHEPGRSLGDRSSSTTGARPGAPRPGRSRATSCTRRGPTRSPDGSLRVTSICRCVIAPWLSTARLSCSAVSSSPSCATRSRA